ncbi:hypothetical protein V5799_000220, partial [Amblyomma americanum]
MSITYLNLAKEVDSRPSRRCLRGKTPYGARDSWICATLRNVLPQEPKVRLNSTTPKEDRSLKTSSKE